MPEVGATRIMIVGGVMAILAAAVTCQQGNGFCSMLLMPVTNVWLGRLDDALK